MPMLDGEPDLLSKICTTCKHLNDPVLMRCMAFPKGIPLKIWNGDNDHTKPFKGDDGIIFEGVS